MSTQKRKSEKCKSEVVVIMTKLRYVWGERWTKKFRPKRKIFTCVWAIDTETSDEKLRKGKHIPKVIENNKIPSDQSFTFIKKMCECAFIAVKSKYTHCSRCRKGR